MPVHNGADTIAETVTSFYRDVAVPAHAELFVCEDGSTDGTAEILGALSGEVPMRLLVDRSRKGYGGAIRDGLVQIRTPFTFFADSDGQYDPKDFWRLWNEMDGHDMVIGQKMKREEALHRIVLSRGFHVLVKALTGVPLKDIDCGFRIIRKEVAEDVLPEVDSLPFSFWAEFTILAHRRGFRILEVPVSHRPRLSGTTTIYKPEQLPAIVLQQFLGLISLSRRLREMASKT